MPAARGFLERFRTSGTPGAAAGGGVPADRVAERDAELAAVFERLERTEAECAARRVEARQRAEARRIGASSQARALLTAARRDAESERREAATRIAERADEETALALRAAEEEAERIARHAATALPDYLDRVVASVRAELGLDDAGRPG
jgi:hypothetical protein